MLLLSFFFLKVFFSIFFSFLNTASHSIKKKKSQLPCNQSQWHLFKVSDDKWMKEIIYSPTQPSTSKQGRRAGWLPELSRRLAACLQVKTLWKLSVPMNYLCKMLKLIIMFAKKIMDFFCAPQSTKQMRCGVGKLSPPLFFLIDSREKITKPTQTHKFKKKKKAPFSLWGVESGSRPRRNLSASEQRSSTSATFVRLKRLWSEVAVWACLCFNISNGVTVAAAAVSGEVLPRVCAVAAPAAGFAGSRRRLRINPRSFGAHPGHAATANKVWAEREGGVREHKRRVDSLGWPTSSNTRPRKGAGALCALRVARFSPSMGIFLREFSSSLTNTPPVCVCLRPPANKP